MSVKTKETIEVKFINDKPKYPKFSSGSLKLLDETWISVAPEIPIASFGAGMAYDVETITNAKGYKTIVAVGGAPAPKKEVAPTTGSATTTPRKERDFDAEARGKTRCVQFEAALRSPALPLLAENTVESVIEIATKLANAGVTYTFGGK